MNETTAKLLEKALLVSPDDWETRAHLVLHYLEAGAPQRAEVLLQASPAPARTEDHRLLAARVRIETDPDAALAALQEILAANPGCARAYLLLARLYLKRGLKEDARRKYGAATVIDESLADPQFEALLGLANPPGGLPPTPVAIGQDPRSLAPGNRPGPEVSPEEIASALDELQRGDDGEVPKTTFADIGGMHEVIERIRMNIIYPFKNPEVFRKFNKRPGGGILLYGPPGCGKTHLARATAGECGAAFLSIAVTDVLSKWLGESERHLHELFESAGAGRRPCFSSTKSTPWA